MPVKALETLSTGLNMLLRIYIHTTKNTSKLAAFCRCAFLRVWNSFGNNGTNGTWDGCDMQFQENSPLHEAVLPVPFVAAVPSVAAAPFVEFSLSPIVAFTTFIHPPIGTFF